MAKGDAVFDLEKAFYVLQKRNPDTGEWKAPNYHVYTGRTDAAKVLERVRSENPGEMWRQVLRQEAERYREGWNDCHDYIKRTLGLEVPSEEFPNAPLVPSHRSVSSDASGRVPPLVDREE